MLYSIVLSKDRTLAFISQRLGKMVVVFFIPFKMMHSNKLCSMLKECCQKGHSLMSHIGSVAGCDNIFLLISQGFLPSYYNCK